jgi:hypothetical protein
MARQVTKLKIVLHCYIVEPQWLTVLHNLLHAVTFRKILVINSLQCYINDNDDGYLGPLSLFETAVQELGWGKTVKQFEFP